MSNFLGVGFKFPFSVGPNGGIQFSKYETNIEEAVRIIIGTALGERQMRPAWGCAVHDYVFAPNNTNTQTLVAHAVEESLQKHEFRIRNIEVTAQGDPDQAERILIDVRYEIRATNSIHNLVFPFYLTGS
ncbi:MAG: GPW/gp25 family protein [Deltaproteobacteria bacterium]|nr:GPW/gp25 family protein [Deltaproteobacteria bacterium]